MGFEMQFSPKLLISCQLGNWNPPSFRLFGRHSFCLVNGSLSHIHPSDQGNMASVMHKFIIASMFMWMAPLIILYGFNHQIFPGLSRLSSSSHTLLSGFIAVIAVNVVMVFYVVMAMKEPPSSSEPQPDPSFLAQAKASITQMTANQVNDECATSVPRDKED